MRVLITGATGFIGREIVTRLLSDETREFQVTGVTRKIDAADKLADVNYVEADIAARTSVSSLTELGSFDAVVHSAGLAHQFAKIDESRFVDVNVNGTGNIAELAAAVGARHFILISSTAVYGLATGEIDEDSICAPDTPYAKSKLKAEEVCREICEKNGVSLTIFRLAPVLGEKGVGNVPRLIRAINKRKFVWLGTGRNSKSVIYVGDIANACVKLLKEKKNATTELYNLANAPIKMSRLVEIICEALGKKVPPFSIPASLPRLAFMINSATVKLNAVERLSKTVEKWLSDDIYVARKIKDDYGFEPETSIEDAIRMQCRWFLERDSK